MSIRWACCLWLGVLSSHNLLAQSNEVFREIEASMSEQELTDLDDFMLDVAAGLKSIRLRHVSDFDQQGFQPSPRSGIDDLFPEDPINRRLPQDNPYYAFTTFTGIQGAAFIVALETLDQTLNFFGVKYRIKREGTRVQFQVASTEKGYFRQLDSLAVTFALREFSRYLVAHLCGNPSMDNFHQAFTQVPPEDIGLRFKYDMAWVLLGNYLPREPNAIFALGSRWSTVGKLLDGSKSLNQSGDQGREVKFLSGLIDDAVKWTVGLSRLECFVDILPKPREEIRKRLVVKKLLDLDKRLWEKQAQYGEIIVGGEKSRIEDQTKSLKEKLNP